MVPHIVDMDYDPKVVDPDIADPILAALAKEYSGTKFHDGYAEGHSGPGARDLSYEFPDRESAERFDWQVRSMLPLVTTFVSPRDYEGGYN